MRRGDYAKWCSSTVSEADRTRAHRSSAVAADSPPLFVAWRMQCASPGFSKRHFVFKTARFNLRYIPAPTGDPWRQMRHDFQAFRAVSDAPSQNGVIRHDKINSARTGGTWLCRCGLHLQLASNRAEMNFLFTRPGLWQTKIRMTSPRSPFNC
jgi:hypothetical protein